MPAPPRLTPDQMIVYYLDEIAGRLSDQISQGLMNSKFFTVGTEWYPLIAGWSSITIFNDGDADVYPRLRNDTGQDMPWAEGEAPLKKGENLAIDLRGKKQASEEGSPALWFICQAGTAAIRVFQVI